jgi:O-methyltransferase domain/Dimerisation domain
MAQELKRRSDDRPVWDVILSTIGTRAVVAAHQLKLFPLLGERPRTLQEICGALSVAPRPAQAMLSACASLGLVDVSDGRFSLTPVAEDYLLPTSPMYLGSFLEFGLVVNERLYALETVQKALATGEAQVYGTGELFKSHEEQAALMRGFTEMMHAHSIGAAITWPDKVDLSSTRLMLDVAGGSGAHSIGALRRWPKLQAVVFEIPPVCPVTEEFAARYELADRIRAQPGDMWKDPFPKADLHFYADIFHDWPPEKCQFLAKKSFDALEPGGRIILHEMLFNDDKSGPFSTAAYSVAMSLWTEGQQFSGKELTALLTEAGFREVETKPSAGYFSIVVGRKPR